MLRGGAAQGEVAMVGLPVRRAAITVLPAASCEQRAGWRPLGDRRYSAGGAGQASGAGRGGQLPGGLGGCSRRSRARAASAGRALSHSWIGAGDGEPVGVGSGRTAGFGDGQLQQLADSAGSQPEGSTAGQRNARTCGTRCSLTGRPGATWATGPSSPARGWAPSMQGGVMPR